MNRCLSLLAETSLETTYDFSQVGFFTETWHWAALAGVCIAVLAVVVFMYLIDSVELPRAIGVLLLSLRIVAFGGLLFIFLNLEKRTVETSVRDSRVVFLIDTSESMSRKDIPDPLSSGPSEKNPPLTERITPVVRELTSGKLLPNLRAQHEVLVYRFDRNTDKLDAFLPKDEAPKTASEDATSPGDEYEDFVTQAFYIGAGLFSVSLLLGLTAVLVRNRNVSFASWCFLGSVWLLVGGTVLLAAADLMQPRETETAEPADEASQKLAQEIRLPTEWKQAEWQQKLQARGPETRLGDALMQVVNKERGGPVAGIVVISDGCVNSGSPYLMAVDAAEEAGIPITTVGLGPDKRPRSAAIVAMKAPSKVAIEHPFKLSGYLQSYGNQNGKAKVRLVSAPANVPNAPEIDEADPLPVEFGPDGQIKTVEFELKAKLRGQRVYRLKLTDVKGEEDVNPADNEKSQTITIEDQKIKVLLLAGGPTREYGFLRNQLYRDDNVESDVLLQTWQEGTAQESNKLLKDFPTTEAEMFKYDCIVAFDPDWRKFSKQQIDLLEKWIAEEAGGIVLVCGRVATQEWTSTLAQSPVIDVVKGIYPVTFSSYDANVKREDRHRVEFTSPGQRASFLRLQDPELPDGDSAAISAAAWNQFDGVYGYYAVKEIKPGAEVYATLADAGSLADSKPVFLVGQKYKRGRSLFLSSGEMWRIREVDDRYFHQFYTNLIRYAAEPRRNKDSQQGRLWFEPETCQLSEVVTVRGHLYDEAGNPLTQDKVGITRILPDGTRESMTLEKVVDATSPGEYAGRFTTSHSGNYGLEFTSLQPAAYINKPLGAEKNLSVEVPQLELEQTLRNDAVLSRIAKQTGGTYFIGLDTAMAGDALNKSLSPNPQESKLLGAPNDDFRQRLKWWSLGIICGALCVEWLIRRLGKLA